MSLLVPEITLEVTADAVAWYGAVVATSAAVVSLYSALRDRSRISLDFGKNYRRIESWDNPLFYVSVINHGRRPVKIDKAWIKRG